MRILDPETSSVAAEIEQDGRFSASQLSAMLKFTRQDPTAEVIGMDEKVRPVIRARLGGAQRKSRFALLANGRPHEVVGKVAEPWR